ncbi:MAG: AAA family ATPase [Terracidiphilus sp.]|jgi:recombinational DNA repair ATPase RecF
MAEVPYFIESLRLSGFRAYLQPKTFDFLQKPSLAIFAPNGSGKSGVIDALDFMLSKDGTLERLGLRAVNNQAGPTALAHNLADEAKIESSVTIGFIQGKQKTSGCRVATGALRPMPPAAATVNRCLAVNPIIRGHALRTFVEGQTPEQRYADVAAWLQLGPLAEVQKNLRVLRAQVKASAEDMSSIRMVDGHLARETGNAVTDWNDQGVLDHINRVVLAPLDPTLLMTTLTETDPTYLEVVKRATDEEREIGLAGLRQIRNAAAAVSNQAIDRESDRLIVSGAVSAFEAAASELSQATEKEAEERRKAAEVVFQAVWKAAQPLFAEGPEPPEACPVCLTPITETTAGSVENIRGHLATHLGELEEYAAAKTAMDGAQTVATRAQTLLVAATDNLRGLLGASDTALTAAIAVYREVVDSWTSGDPPSSGPVVAKLAALVPCLKQKIDEIEARQGDHTYRKAKAKVDRLIELRAEREAALRTHSELQNLSLALNGQAKTISAEIRKKVQALLDLLETPMNEIYKTIQGDAAASIRLELPAEDDTTQQRLNLVIDFAKNRAGVQPGGYLSDSQIHSVALALRLAAIKQFNRTAPFIALDDIVTSYDADHRRAIAGLIATDFSRCQILLATHDVRFFNYLKDQLDERIWHFTRIIGLDPSYGPRFADHKVTDEMIEALWDAGTSAANEIRQAEEEWLLGICREFGVKIRIRELDKAYSYERSELASALAGYLKGAKIEPRPVSGVSNRFLTSLQKGEIENFGSHFQDSPYGGGSIGDERARWEEFKAFRGQFVCQKCRRTRFKRPNEIRKPVCAHEGCEAQFEF